MQGAPLLFRTGRVLLEVGAGFVVLFLLQIDQREGEQRREIVRIVLAHREELLACVFDLVIARYNCASVVRRSREVGFAATRLFHQGDRFLALRRAKLREQQQRGLEIRLDLERLFERLARPGRVARDQLLPCDHQARLGPLHVALQQVSAAA